jgi:uncharacterized membrane protein
MIGFLVHFASLFALSLWVGGGAALAFLAAPAIFEHAGSRQKAGDIVGHILKRFDTVAFASGSVALLAGLLELGATVGAPRTLSLKLALIAAMLGLALYSRLALAPEIRLLRDALGEVDAVPKDDPRRRAFGRLHGFSVLCLMGEILLGALAMGLSVMMLAAP